VQAGSQPRRTQVAGRIGGIGHRLVDEHQEALRILAEHDPGAA
jgi:hypothetical protein